MKMKQHNIKLTEAQVEKAIKIAKKNLFIENISAGIRFLIDKSK